MKIISAASKNFRTPTNYTKADEEKKKLTFFFPGEAQFFLVFFFNAGDKISFRCGGGR